MTKYLLSIVSGFLCSILYSQNIHENDRALLYYTTQLKCTKLNPVTHKIDTVAGTAFFFDFAQDLKYSRPYIVTNKHVIAGAILGIFSLHKKFDNGTADSISIDVTLLNFERRWIGHPDKNVDLCIMPIAPLLNLANNQGYKIFYNSLNQNNIPDNNEWQKLNVIEGIRFIGYPIGLADTVHNFPVFRSGYTASPPFVDYNGKSEFLIDAPCYPGSSGSPVFILDSETKMLDNKFTFVRSQRFMFLGVLYGGPVYTSVGKIIVQNIPTQLTPFSVNQIPANLGYIIKSNRILDFHEIITSK